MSATQQLYADYPQTVSCDTCPVSKETWLKAFLIDDSINRNFWHIPENALKKYIDGFKGRPLISHPSGDHPDYLAEGLKEASPTFIQDILKHQEQYKIGDIVDVKYEAFKDNPDKQAYFAYIRLTDPNYLQSVKQGASSFYVSPQIFDLDQKPPGEATVNFLPLHLAVVKEPAYGNIARVKASCNGESQSCINALKKASHDENSYFVSSAANNQTYRNLSSNQQSPQLDPNYPGLTNLAKILETAGIDLNQTFTYNSSTGGYQPTTTSKTTKTKKVDQEGNLITETQDFRPGKQQAPLQQQQQEQQYQQTAGISTNPTTIPTNQLQQPNTNNIDKTGLESQPNTTSTLQNTNNSTPQVPEEILQKLKEFESMKSEFEEIKKFKQTQEEKQLLAASEAQRQVIDNAFMPLFPDDGERQQVTDFFVSLNVSDQQLQQLLEFVTKGTLNTDNSAAQTQGKQQAPPKDNAPPVKGAEIENVIPVIAHTRRKGVKGASLIMSSSNPALEYDEYGNKTTSTFSKGFLGDINWENLL